MSLSFTLSGLRAKAKQPKAHKCLYSDNLFNKTSYGVLLDSINKMHNYKSTVTLKMKRESCMKSQCSGNFKNVFVFVINNYILLWSVHIAYLMHYAISSKQILTRARVKF